MSDILESLLTTRVQKREKVILTLLCILVVLSIGFQWALGFDRITPEWTFSTAVDLLGVAVCAVIFYSYMQSTEAADDREPVFMALTTVIGLNLFLDQLTWLVQGDPSLAFWNKVVNVLFYANTCTVEYVFWVYMYRALHMEGKFIETVRKYIPYIYVASLIACFVNLFYPLYFSVDVAGVYSRESGFALSMVFTLVVIVTFIIGLVRSKAPRPDKGAAISFVVLPIIGEILSIIHFGLSLQPVTMMLSVVFTYGIIVARRGQKLTATKTELGMAARIQSSMMPHDFPPFPDRKEFDIYATMTPAKEVGGDFFDFYLIDDDHICIEMADVSGKGVPASLYMMSSKIILQSCAMLGQSVSEILAKTNKALCANTQVEMFVTVWIGILEISTGKLTAANAGHEYPVVMNEGSEYEVLKDKHGFVVGGMDGIQYKDYEIQLEPGNKFFIYTDGVTEATNKDVEMFGMERLVDALNKDPDASPQGTVENVRNAISTFVGGADQFDDITMLCLKYNGPNK